MEGNRPRVLFIDNTHPFLKEELGRMGYLCEEFPEMKREEYGEIIGSYTGIIIRSRIRLDREILQRAKKLKFIGRVGAGMDSIDLQAAADLGIACLNSPEGNRDSLGEHAIGMLIVLMHNILRADSQVRAGRWIREDNRGTEIMGKTVAIIGYGNMGGAFARRLKGFGARVIAYDKYKKGFSDEFVTEASMDEVFAMADILSLHVPLTPETEYLVKDPYIRRFQKEFFLLNTARGRVVHTGDLVKHLESGKIRGAALDVLEYEDVSFEELSGSALPGPYQYLINSGRVVLTPHIAGWTVESKLKLAQVLAEKIRALGPA